MSRDKVFPDECDLNLVSKDIRATFPQLHQIVSSQYRSDNEMLLTPYCIVYIATEQY